MRDAVARSITRPTPPGRSPADRCSRPPAPAAASSVGKPAAPIRSARHAVRLQRVLILRAAGPSADAQILNGLQEYRLPGHASRLGRSRAITWSELIAAVGQRLER